MSNKVWYLYYGIHSRWPHGYYVVSRNPELGGFIKLIMSGTCKEVHVMKKLLEQNA